MKNFLWQQSQKSNAPNLNRARKHGLWNSRERRIRLKAFVLLLSVRSKMRNLISLVIDNFYEFYLSYKFIFIVCLYYFYS